MSIEHQLPPLELLKQTAILTDVDGTATNLERRITSRTLRAITQAEREQLKLGLCTGRQVAQLVSLCSAQVSRPFHSCGGGRWPSSDCQGRSTLEARDSR
jgi:hypothetical protein